MELALTAREIAERDLKLTPKEWMLVDSAPEIGVFEFWVEVAKNNPASSGLGSFSLLKVTEIVVSFSMILDAHSGATPGSALDQVLLKKLAATALTINELGTVGVIAPKDSEIQNEALAKKSRLEDEKAKEEADKLKAALKAAEKAKAKQ